MTLNYCLEQRRDDYFRVVYDTFGGSEADFDLYNIYLDDWLRFYGECEVEKADYELNFYGDMEYVIYLVGWNMGGSKKYS